MASCMAGPTTWKSSSPSAWYFQAKLILLCLQTLDIFLCLWPRIHSVPRPRTLEIGQPYPVSCQHTPRLSPKHISGLILLVIPVSVTLVQAFISFCWDQCSSLPTDFLSFSLALSSLFAILLLFTSYPISPALSATVSLYESVMRRRVLHESYCLFSSLL